MRLFHHTSRVFANFCLSFSQARSRGGTLSDVHSSLLRLGPAIQVLTQTKDGRAGLGSLAADFSSFVPPVPRRRASSLMEACHETPVPSLSRLLGLPRQRPPEQQRRRQGPTPDQEDLRPVPQCEVRQDQPGRRRQHDQGGRQADGRGDHSVADLYARGIIKPEAGLPRPAHRL